MTDNKKLWDSVMVEIELNVSKPTYALWFKDTYVIKQEDGIVFISVSNAFVKDWLFKNFHKQILKGLREHGENIRGIEYVIAKDDGRRKEPEMMKNGVQNKNSSLPLQDFYINKEDNLNPKYTFENFVVGPFNELAFAAAQAILKKPGEAYNPLFVSGETGRGKTHLIQALGNALKTNYPNKKVFYLTSEKFTIDYVASLQSNKTQAFKDKYRKYDVFIMDDVQFLSNKEKTQEELFHLFNALCETNKQIIFSSDKHPNYIASLEDRLKSRFSAGMIIEIPAPDHESRIAILKAKAQAGSYSISAEIIDYLASSIEGNIRELEGTLNTVICQMQLKNKELSLIDVKKLIKNSIKPKKSIATKDIIKTIADFYNIEEESIYEKTRKKEIVKPRQMIMYILREDFNISYPSIGQKLGGRDHTTVMHSCEKIKNELKVNNLLVQEVSQIRAIL